MTANPGQVPEVSRTRSFLIYSPGDAGTLRGDLLTFVAGNENPKRATVAQAVPAPLVCVFVRPDGLIECAWAGEIAEVRQASGQSAMKAGTRLTIGAQTGTAAVAAGNDFRVGILMKSSAPTDVYLDVLIWPSYAAIVAA